MLLRCLVLLFCSVVIYGQRGGRGFEDRPIPRPKRQNGFPIDDLVAAIATAAMNGVIPLHKMNLGNPNRKGDAPLRIPILLIRQNDLRSLKNVKKLSNDRPFSGNINRRGPRNGRDYFKKDYSPKPKFPTQGMKVIPAPKNLELEKSSLKKNFDKKPIMQFNNNRFNGMDRDIQEFTERYVDSLNGKGNMNMNNFNKNHNDRGQFKLKMNEERDNRNRLNKFRPIDEEQNERIRQSDRWQPQDNGPNTYELPEKEPERPLNDDDYDEEQLPPLKPVVKVPTIVRHVYGAKPLADNEKPTIPPRYLKSISEIPSSSGSHQQDYDNRDNSDDERLPPLTKIPPLSQILPPLRDGEEQTYKTERVVVHKSIDLGDVYRKPSETGEEDLEEQGDEQSGQDDEGPLAGYGKDPYDKQLISTLTKLMATSKNRHPLNIGGLTGAEDTKQSAKPVSKPASKYFTSSASGGQTSSDTFDKLFGGKPTTTYKASNSQQLTPQSQSSSHSTSQSRIPESLLSSFTSLSSSRYSSGSQGSVNKEGLSTDNNNKGLVPLPPNQVPVVPSVTRKPVFLPLDYSTNDRPLAADKVFDDAIDEYGPAKSAQA